MHEIRYQISEDEYVAAQELFKRKAYKLRWLGTAVLLAIGMMAIWLGWRMHQWWIALGGLVYASMPWWCFGLLTNYRLRRNFRQYPAMQEQQTASVQEDAVLMHSRLGESRLPWTMLVQWSENEQFMLLYLQPRLYFIVPKRADTDGQFTDALRTQLTAHGVRKC